MMKMRMRRTVMVTKILRRMMKATKAGKPFPPNREISRYRSQSPCKLSSLAEERIFSPMRVFCRGGDFYLLRDAGFSFEESNLNCHQFLVIILQDY